MRQPFEVVSRCELGDDSAELSVQVDLGVDDVAQDPATAFDDRD